MLPTRNKVSVLTNFDFEVVQGNVDYDFFGAENLVALIESVLGTVLILSQV